MMLQRIRVLPLLLPLFYTLASAETTQGIEPKSVNDQPTRATSLSPGFLSERGAKMKLSGQLNFVGFYAYDGQDRGIFWGSNASTVHRFTINGELPVAYDWRVGSRIQLGFDISSSDAVNQLTDTIDGTIDLRWVEVYLGNDCYGTFTIGKGKTASDFTSLVDFSGTDVIAESSVNDVGGGLYFRNSDLTLSTTRVNDVVDNIDGFSRRNRLRYDSPDYHGFSFALSTSEGERNDLALHYTHQFDKAKFSIKGAYTNGQTVDDAGTAVHANGLNGSLSLLLDNGFSLTYADGQLYTGGNTGRKDPYYFYIKPGYQFAHSIGVASFSVDYGRFYNFAQNRDQATSYSVAAVQNVADWNIDLSASFRIFRLSRIDSSFQDIHVFALGIRYRF